MNNQDFRYQLDSPRITGRRQQKTTCPHCHRKHCFVRYVDTQNNCQYVDDCVGRCDHEQSCGYHYKPSEFYHDNPWKDNTTAAIPQCKKEPERPLIPIPSEYFMKSMSPKSTFWQWFTTDCLQKAGFTQDDADRVFHDYGIGATKTEDVIFWQVDEQWRIRSGHVMHYNSEGHREGYQGWVHARLIQQGLLPKDFRLQQCFFGQHLLAVRPDDTVCIVESEKTALIMAALKPEYVWLATSGSSGLTAEKCDCLKGRRVVLFPDSGCLEKWQTKMRQTCDIAYSFCQDMEQYPPNTDLADLLL